VRILKITSCCILALGAMATGQSDHDAPFATRVISMQYPGLAAAARITGTAVLRVRVDGGGNVLSTRGLSGHPVLVKAAEANLRLWRFSTLGQRRQKAETEFDFTYVFQLKGGSDTSRPCSGLTYEYPDRVTIVSEAPHLMP